METKTTPVHPLLEGTMPGPWQQHDRTEIYAGGYFVGTTRGNGTLPEQIVRIDEANAKLIAAAPSLAAENALLAEQVERLRKGLEMLHDTAIDARALLANQHAPIDRMALVSLLTDRLADTRELLTSLTPACK